MENLLVLICQILWHVLPLSWKRYYYIPRVMSEKPTSLDCFCCPVNHKAILCRIESQKTKNISLTFLGSCNYDRTEKFSLIVIGHGYKPYLFGMHNTQEIGFDHKSKSRAWMKRKHSFAWCERYDTYIAQTKRRRALVRLGNCSANASLHVYSVLRDVELFLSTTK